MQGFEGNERFEVITRLGRGAMGSVYQVVDRERSRRVALKTVGHVDGDALLRFKREFRELQSVQHPNIVELGELHEERGEWFFTMELIDGDDFLTYVRGESARWITGSAERPAFGVYSHDPTLTSLLPADVSVTLHRQEEPDVVPSGDFDEVRLRRALGQLALAVAALHRHGRVHRDLKSSNVLVTHEGRVVVIDFGLVTVLEPQLQSMELHVVGTVAYMAPEQAAGTPIGPEADWYSVGVMLFEALTGTLPFSGPPLQVLVEKQTLAPPSPRSLVPEVPEDLDRLCTELLRLDPKQRPTEAAILARLHVGPEETSGRPSTGSFGPHRTVFVGRAHELARLREAMDRALRGQQALVSVVGASGIGKSALVERFLHETVALAPGAVLLVGKCYEHEYVPFKALDGVIDQLSRFLRRAAPDEVAELLPPDVELLERTFPVLKRVPAIAEARGHGPEIRDPQERRLRVRSALRMLVGNVARRWPTVIVIDDLQWSDEDSFGLLTELVRRPAAPACLLVFTARPPAKTDESLVRILDASMRIEVGPLSLDESEELARHISGSSLDPVRMRSLALQAEGFPFFLDTLLRRPFGAEAADPVVDLDTAIRRIVGELEPGSRKLLEIVCLAGSRIGPEIAGEAADLEPDQLGPRIKVLRHAKLVRSAGSRAAETVEPYHDRIRTAVVAALDTEARRRVHLALARAYDAHHGPPEALASHFFAAGDLANASKYLTLAARAATEALAFERAADFYARALDLGQGTRRELRELAIRRGEALASAGYGPRAAEAFAAAIPDVGPIEALALRVRIAEQLLTSGHHEDGVGAALAFSQSLELAYPESPRLAWFELVRLRALVTLRGYSVKLRDPDSMSREELLRVDSCWALAKGLASHDIVRSQVFHTKGLLRALDCGEPYRVSRAFAFEALNVAATRPADVDGRAWLLGRASDIAHASGQPHATAFVAFIRLYARYVAECDWSIAYSLPAVEEEFRTRCSDVAWETGLCVTARALCLAWLGRWKELSLSVGRIADEALARGFHYVYAHLLGHAQSLGEVLRGNYEDAHAHVDAARGSIEGDPSPVEAFFYRSWHLRVDLAEGNVDGALARMAAVEQSLADSFLLRAPILQTIDRHDRAFVALAAARDGREDARGRHRREAKRAASALERDHTAPGRAFGALTHAALAALDGDTKRALELLADAENRFADLDMRGYRHAALARRGHLLGGVKGAALLDRAFSFLRGEGAVHPEAIVDMLSPGFLRLSGPPSPPTR